MHHDTPLMTRRQFLRTGLLGGALASTLPVFLDQTLRRLEAAELATGLQRAHGKDAPILVFMQLGGGNDGLNTVIPLQNDHYRRARPRLGRIEAEALRLNDTTGLHPALTGLKSLYDDGLLGILQGVGYPNPNRSHFRSTEIWHTASSEDRNPAHGWLGRFFDNACPGLPPETGIALTESTPQAFAGASGMGITFTDPNRFRFNDDLDPMDGASIGMATGQHAPGHTDALSFLERTDLDARVSSDTLHDTLKRTPEPNGFPRSRLGADLRLIARLIGGSMPTRVYYCSQGGYDTHANQLNTHARLLQDLGDSLQAFWTELKRQGNTRRVCMMVFSEFGRRVAENGSQGTDHGAAAPVLLLGGPFPPGLHGPLPSLAPEDLRRGDPVHHTDFRHLYATLLANHLQADPATILGPNTPLFTFPS